MKHTLKSNRTVEFMSDSDVRFEQEKSDVVKRLKSIQKDESTLAFSKRCGVSESGLRKILNGGSPNLDTLTKIARACGVSLSWLAGGELDSDPISTDMQPADDSLYIESFPDVRAAAGAGQLSPVEQSIVKLKVSTDVWRRYVGLDHRHVKVITVHGESMRPALSHGDQVMVDTACHTFVDDAIYCIQQGENLRFKRIKLNLDGSIFVRSDNQNGDYPPETYTAEQAAQFKIIGKVIPFKFGFFDI